MVHRPEVMVFLGALALAGGPVRAEEDGVQIIGGAAELKKFGKGKVNAATGESQAAVRLGKNAFLLNAETQVDFDIDFDTEPDNLFFRTASIAMGGMHGVFDPEQKTEREIRTQHATIGIRGTAMYVEVQGDENRTYRCCCYGGIDISNMASGERLRQQASYHEAYIITADGAIKPALYDQPLNHYDDTLMALEKTVSRQPRWNLPNDEMQFLTREGQSLFKRPI
jgi:hypothetical protein